LLSDIKVKLKIIYAKFFGEIFEMRISNCQETGNTKRTIENTMKRKRLHPTKSVALH